MVVVLVEALEHGNKGLLQVQARRLVQQEALGQVLLVKGLEDVFRLQVSKQLQNGFQIRDRLGAAQTIVHVFGQEFRQLTRRLVRPAVEHVLQHGAQRGRGVVVTRGE